MILYTRLDGSVSDNVRAALIPAASLYREYRSQKSGAHGANVEAYRGSSQRFSLMVFRAERADYRFPSRAPRREGKGGAARSSGSSPRVDSIVPCECRIVKRPVPLCSNVHVIYLRGEEKSPVEDDERPVPPRLSCLARTESCSQANSRRTSSIKRTHRHSSFVVEYFAR